MIGGDLWCPVSVARQLFLSRVQSEVSPEGSWFLSRSYSHTPNPGRPALLFGLSCQNAPWWMTRKANLPPPYFLPSFFSIFASCLILMVAYFWKGGQFLPWKTKSVYSWPDETCCNVGHQFWSGHWKSNMRKRGSRGGNGRWLVKEEEATSQSCICRKSFCTTMCFTGRCIPQKSKTIIFASQLTQRWIEKETELGEIFIGKHVYHQ